MTGLKWTQKDYLDIHINFHCCCFFYSAYQKQRGKYLSYKGFWSHLNKLICLSHMPVQQILLHSRQQVNKSEKQESIPVGCVPSAAVNVVEGLYLPGGVPAGRCTCLGGVPAQGCTCLGACTCPGVYLPGGASQHALRPPREQNDRKRSVKILPCRNFVADGNNHNSEHFLFKFFNVKSIVLSLGEGETRKRTLSLVMPGTKWCGAGDVATDHDDLGKLSDLDRCCRDHDECPQSIEAGKTKYGYYNSRPFTFSSCDCDKR